jgi:PiT family inorganic phosphate transporter
VTIPVVLMALLAASMWNLITWFFGLPSSSSHALIGGLVGAGAAGYGWQVVHLAGLLKVLTALFISPFLGFLVSVLVMRLVIALCASASPVANVYFKFLQIPTGLALALSHGANDAQKTMGVITLGLVVLGYQKAFYVPLWVILLSATAMSLGTAIGGWRIIRTLGGKFYHIRPIHGFVSQFSSAAVVLTASLLGGPVSTSQVVSSAIVGAGAAQRRSQVRWGVLGEILIAWLLTIPASAGLGALLYGAFRTVFR